MKLLQTFTNLFTNIIGPNTEANIPKVKNISPEKFLRNRNQLNFIIAHVSKEVVT